jgi:transcriptional activator of comK gene
LKRFGVILLSLLLLVGCGNNQNSGSLNKVGLLVPDTVDDQVWGSKGYQGLLKIQSRYNVDVFYKEGVDSIEAVKEAVKDFDRKGVNLIFGHGNEYAEYFNEIADEYSHIHFVSFNGDAREKNTTSLNFNSYAMGFFGGMVAGKMTKTNKIGVIAAFEWQPEVEGFYDGALYQNEHAEVTIKYVGHWNDNEKAFQQLENMLDDEIDIIYPAGDGYNVPVIEKIKDRQKFAIGFINDQSDLGESTVLTSTVQHVDKLYEMIAGKYNEGKLKRGNLFFDFQDGVISLGKFSPLIDYQFKEEINGYIETYIAKGKLPSEH